ncbi:MAG: hypothetical protein PHR28_03165 [candidate division Zixibacteria bacterium]|jgi:hypothetical protein|nr:hypothetical protein [candidate division Zixibacteria bacterium]
MVVPGKCNNLAVVASILLIFGGVMVAVLTEYGVVGIAIIFFGFTIWRIDGVVDFCSDVES